jgi:hypothetical protein
VDRELAGLTEPAEIMGAVAWAVLRGGDEIQPASNNSVVVDEAGAEPCWSTQLVA